MPKPNLRNPIDALEEICVQNKKIIEQNVTIIAGIDELLSETRDVKGLNDNQLKELKELEKKKK